MRAAVLGATLAVPDGQPLVWALRALGHARATRVYGPDLMARFCARAAARGHARSTSTAGARRGARAARTSACASASPGLRIAGGYSPPFRELTPPRRSSVIAEIDGSRRRRWCGSAPASPSRSCGWRTMRPRLSAPLLVGVGAAFDFHAGLVPQAPPWMQRNGLEWIYRLCARAAPAVAALRPLQPALRGRLRAPVPAHDALALT